MIDEVSEMKWKIFSNSLQSKYKLSRDKCARNTPATDVVNLRNNTNPSINYEFFFAVVVEFFLESLRLLKRKS